MKRALVLLVSASLLVGVAGCGSDDEPRSGETPAAAAAETPSSETFTVDESIADPFKRITGLDVLTSVPTLEQLKTRVAEYEAVPDQLLEDEPVSKKATAGKNIALLVCGVPVCTEFYNAMRQAATSLNWKVTKVDLGVSPEDIANAYNRAIELKPDMVVGSGLPRELIDKQLDELEKLDIPVIQWATTMDAVPDKLWVAVDGPEFRAYGAVISEFLAADSELKGNIVSYSVPQYTTIVEQAGAMEDYLPKICPECKIDTQNVAATDIGKLGPKVTGYLQSHPETKYVVCGFGDLCQGVGQALKAAGRTDVKIVTGDPGTTNYQNVATGLEYATRPLPTGQTGWQIVDLAQRIFNGDDTDKTRFAPVQIVTEISDPKSPTIGAVPDYEQKYKALWKVD